MTDKEHMDQSHIVDSYSNPGAGGKPIPKEDVEKAANKGGSLKERMNKMRWI